MARRRHGAALLRLVAACALLLSALAPLAYTPRAALAGDATLTFDDLPTGTPLSIQYRESGVTFPLPPSRRDHRLYATLATGYPTVISQTRIPSGGGLTAQPVVAHSSTQVLQAPTCGCSELYGVGPLAMAFSRPQGSISLDAGFLRTTVSDGQRASSRRLVLTAYDSAGRALASASTATLLPDNRVTTPLAVSDPGGRIVEAIVDQTPPELDAPGTSRHPNLGATYWDFAIDDLHIDNALAAPGPETFVPSITILAPGDVSTLDTVYPSVRALIHTSRFGPGYHVNEIDIWPDGSRHASADTHPGGIGTFTGGSPLLLVQNPTILHRGGINSITLQFVGPDGVEASDTVSVNVPTLPPPVDVAAQAIEVTQAINGAVIDGTPFAATGRQFHYSGEPLVAGKKTVVRLYGTAPTGVAGIAASLAGTDASGRPLPGSPLAPQTGPAGGAGARVAIDPADTVIAKRLNPAKSWNFVLPSSWTRGDIRLIGQVNADHGLPEPPGGAANDAIALDGLHFFPTAGVQIRPHFYVGTYHANTVRSSVYGGAADPSFTDGWLNSVLPVADGGVTVAVPANPTFGQCPTYIIVPQLETGHGDCAGNSQQDLFQNLLNEANDFWGQDSGSDRSLTFRPPVTPYVFDDAQIDATAAGLTGGVIGMSNVPSHAISTEANGIGSFDTSHEGLHGLGMTHSGNAHGAAGGGGAEDWPFCHGGLALQCAGSADTTFRSIGASDARPLGFDTVPSGGDVSRWAASRDAFGGSIIKDPVAHAPAIGLYSSIEPSYSCRPSTLPPPTGTDDQMHYHDILSYGNINQDCVDLGEWMSTINFCRAFFVLSGLYTPDGSNPLDFCKNTRGLLTPSQLASLAGERTIGAAHVGVPAAVATGGNTLAVSGLIDSGTGVRFLPCYLTPIPQGTAPDAHGPYRLELLDRAGKTLWATRFAAQPSSSHARQAPEYFSLRVPFLGATNRLRISRVAPAHILATLARPVGGLALSLVSPRSAATQAGVKMVRLSWKGTAPRGVSVGYDVSLSVDRGKSYRTVAVNIHATTLRLNTASLPGGELIFRVSTCDCFNAASATVKGLHLLPRPPQVVIVTPTDGQRMQPAILLTLRGQAVDPQEGVLAGAALRWTSDRDGFLGTGASLDVATLSAGTHHIMLTATAPDGLAASATRILVVARPAGIVPPTAGKPTPTGAPTASATPQLAATATDTPTAFATATIGITATATGTSSSTAMPSATPTAGATAPPLIIGAATASPNPAFYGATACGNVAHNAITISAGADGGTGPLTVMLRYRYVSSNGKLPAGAYHTAAMALQKGDVYATTIDLSMEPYADLQGTSGTLEYQVLVTDASNTTIGTKTQVAALQYCLG